MDDVGKEANNIKGKERMQSQSTQEHTESSKKKKKRSYVQRNPQSQQKKENKEKIYMSIYKYI